MNYLLLGSEGYLKAQFLERLTKNANIDRTDYQIYRAKETNIGEILSFLSTHPFLSKQKFCVIKNAENFSKTDIDSIIKYLESPAKFSTLILESTVKDVSDLHKGLKKLVRVIDCRRPRESEIVAWIRKEFALYKKKISPQSARLIKEIKGHDLMRLKNEIKKIVTFVGTSHNITEGDIETVLGEPTYKTAFELAELVLAKQTGEAVFFADRLLMREKPHQILNILAWQFRNFMKVKRLSGSCSLQDIAKVLRIGWGFTKKTVEQAKRMTSADIENKMNILMDADLAIKRGKADPRQALLDTLFILCR